MDRIEKVKEIFRSVSFLVIIKVNGNKCKARCGDVYKRQAQSDLEETCKSFDVTKTEYENLEKELEILEEEIQKSREQSTQKTLEKQTLENQIHLLQEQIHSAKQNETQYQERALALEGDIEQRKKEEQSYLEEKSQLEEKSAEFSKMQSQAQEAFKGIAIEIHNLEEAIEAGKNEIIEILNQRASIKGKLQRYDTMMEQISIRKVALNPVSYTHLDVYKRQHLLFMNGCDHQPVQKDLSQAIETARKLYPCLLYTSCQSCKFWDCIWY